MQANKIKSVYFIGAGGIGMSALVRYFLTNGYNVGGYDKIPSELTERLIEEGAQIHYEESVEAIAPCFKEKTTTLVVYTPAIPAEHKELVYFREHGFDIQKRAQVLGFLTQEHKGLCVAGTHGKTTTSTMAAHLLHQSHVDCYAFLGGISKNYGTNYIIPNTPPQPSPQGEGAEKLPSGEALIDKSNNPTPSPCGEGGGGVSFVVIEADEFDRSFHWLRPWMSVITATDPDHLDIYGTKEAYLDSFRHYTTLIQPGGALIIHKGLEMRAEVQDGVRVYEYSRTEGDFHAENIRIGGGEIVFDFVHPEGVICDIQLGVPVSINIDNGIAAMALAKLNGVTDEEIKRGMASFGGVDRRFDFKVKSDRVVFLSDYAHHPNEIEQSVKSIRELYADKKIAAIFQPHLYTRTRDFYREFADSLSLLDTVYLCDIYPAREEPIPGVTSQLIYDNLRPGIEKHLIHKDGIEAVAEQCDFDVLISLGAGDIENYVPKIAAILEKRSN